MGLEGRLTPRGRMHCNDLNGQSPGTHSSRIRPPISRLARNLRRGRNSAAGVGTSLDVEILHIREAEVSRGTPRMPSSTAASERVIEESRRKDGAPKTQAGYSHWILDQAWSILRYPRQTTVQADHSPKRTIKTDRSLRHAGRRKVQSRLPEGRTTHLRSLSALTRRGDAPCGLRPNLGFGRPGHGGIGEPTHRPGGSQAQGH